MRISQIKRRKGHWLVPPHLCLGGCGRELRVAADVCDLCAQDIADEYEEYAQRRLERIAGEGA